MGASAFPRGVSLEGDMRLDRAVFDPEAARTHLGLDAAGFARVLRCVWTEVSERRRRLEEAVAGGDLPTAALHAHTIKSSAATMGAETLRQAAAMVEELAAKPRAGELPAAMTRLRRAADALSKLGGIG